MENATGTYLEVHATMIEREVQELEAELAAKKESIAVQLHQCQDLTAKIAQKRKSLEDLKDPQSAASLGALAAGSFFSGRN